MRTAIIDLGTNTFNLLIAEQFDNTYKILREEKYPAKLGKGGINDKKILPEAMDRGIEALKTHLNTIEPYQVDKILCMATAAIRSASNGSEFVKRVKNELDLDINVIDGQKEAELIFDGVKQVVPIGDERVMILDIGGGSNEFIIANKNGVLWKHSFDLGMARLLDRFNPTDPISQKEIREVESYIKTELDLLYKALEKYPTTTLIGSSGSFDTISNMIAAKHHPFLDMKKVTTYHIPLAYAKEMHQKFLSSSIEERRNMQRMDLHRVEMIVLASIFINFIVDEFQIEEIWQCGFALKEGTILQILNNQL
ncbi:phosphatase [Carboxylicivirga sp. M1479]|uniref:Ppx/GppA phosphatase family protein n=1 Tax=Carboxylicivirga sp. M1479 TaxID=2594476 RepID=UPI001178999B|nr:phosphatase [Carboxylicivirga sp. M1479]TRX72288.1 phosphatase [Carboxylicivirga sp. M1479]